MQDRFKGVQREILDCELTNQLVSAGAGSGKTTVMIEKIADLILSKRVDVDNLLVVTFTVLASQEMKDRLIKKMKEKFEEADDSEKQVILTYIEQIKTASIDTIDGFSSKTIKKYFYELEISPNIQIISDATRDYYISRAMKKTMNDLAKDSTKVNIMLDLFGGNSRNLNGVEDVVLDLYHNIINIYNFESFLTDSKNEYVDAIKSENVVNDYIVSNAKNLESKIKYNFSGLEKSVQDKLLEFLYELEKMNQHFSFKTNLSVLNNLTVPTFSRKEIAENDGLKDLNLEIKNYLEIKNKLDKNQINEDFEQKNAEIINYFNIFLEILKNFINNYNKIKKENDLIDFNDLNRLMLKLLENEQVKDELQNKYQYVFVDECQDINPLQDKLISDLIGENTHLFMVGDVKQSIYGFRGASPELFLNKYYSLKSGESLGKAFDMNVNFRSSPTILNFVNEIFFRLMTIGTADIDYAKDCEIEPKREDIIDEKVKVFLFHDDNEADVEKGVYSVKNDLRKSSENAKNKEAKMVLKIIQDLVGKTFYDANQKVKRELRYEDIAILSRSEKDEGALVLIDILKRANVPLKLTNKLDVAESESVKLVMSILKCVNNTADDVDWLATIMALTDISIDQIVEIRNVENGFYEDLVGSNNAYVLQLFDSIEHIKNKSYVLNNADLIRFILNEKKLRYYFLQKPQGEQELNLLMEFLNKLTANEQNLGLAEFIEVVESNVNKSGDFASQDDENSVTLQTIHKSKGLEYPVVILYNANKIFSHLRENETINFNADIGLGIDYYDSANRVKMNSLTKFAVKIKNAEKGYKEELRLLYVALTRAKNKLFITGTYSPKAIAEQDVNKNSYSNMILSCFVDRIDGDENKFKNCEIYLDYNVDENGTTKTNVKQSVVLKNETFEYPNQQKFRIPFKNTVTGLNSQKVESKKFEIRSWLTEETQFNYEEDKALVGTHYHKALELLDLNLPYVQNTDFEDVDYAKVKLAHEVLSPLVYGAKQIKKEAEFMMLVPYDELVNSSITDRVLVQGVVDLIIERENSVDIVDYKFSSLPANVLKEKYCEQLKLYKLAVEKAFNKKVEHMFIYSIKAGELV